jgi:threonine dehydratase
VEGSAGVSIGAYMENADKFHGKNVAIVSCGANIGYQTLQQVLSKYGGIKV